LFIDDLFTIFTAGTASKCTLYSYIFLVLHNTGKSQEKGVGAKAEPHHFVFPEPDSEPHQLEAATHHYLQHFFTK
jgi:hypothetical protein